MTKKATSKKLKIKKPVDEHRLVMDYLKESIQSDFGVESIMQMNEDAKSRAKVSFSYGWSKLDEISGIGGLPRGRVIEIFGPESGGKTTMTLHAVCECQKLGGIACFIDAEHALDVEYAKALGVDVDDLLLNQPDYGEQAFQIANKLILAKKKKEAELPNVKEIPLLVVVDSVSALVPEAELKGLLEEGKGAGLGAQARMMSEGLRGLTLIMGKTNTNVIFVNQTRSKIGGFGNPEVTTGGNALKFYASIRMRVSKGEQVKSGENVIGSGIKIKIVKNKLAPPFKVCEGLITYGEGIDRAWDVWAEMKDKDLVKMVRKPWMTIPKLPEVKKFAGYKSFKSIYGQNKTVIDSLLVGA